METKEIKSKSIRSVKWSMLGEIFAKIAAPISTMALTRILIPEIYGIAVAVTIILTFCETVSEGGFSKYLIQHDFSDVDQFKKYFSVTFFSSLFFSFLLCAFIIIFREGLSRLIGNSGYEIVLVVSTIQIPIVSINELFVANLKRNFRFEKVFIARLIYSITPFIITIPLAIAGFGFWSLVIGMTAAQLLQTPFLIATSKKVLKPFFSFKILKEVLSSSIIMILESAIIWGCSWISTVFAAYFFDAATVAIVKVSNSTVDSIFALFGTAFISVLFPTLSRLRHTQKEYKESFFEIQSAAMSILIPLGIGAFFYSKTITSIFLGSQWSSAAFVIAMYSITKPLMYCFNNFLSETYRSKGQFLASIVYHVISLAVNVLLMLTIGKINYFYFILCVPIMNILRMVASLILLSIVHKISFIEQMKSLIPTILCSAFMCCPILLNLNGNYSFAQTLGQIVVCAFLYFVCLNVLFPKTFKNSIKYLGIKK